MIRNHRTEVSGQPLACKKRVVMKVTPQTPSSLEQLIFLLGSGRYSSRLLHKLHLIHHGDSSLHFIFECDAFVVDHIAHVTATTESEGKQIQYSHSCLAGEEPGHTGHSEETH